ncbi:uncharacterized protein JCM6883_004325 [Sporobolomyces salmoneus]|uniref:uncharacterized protein n=1 Tax=Sporobolomyces salmoneus TaxID=183962 RepID=UPI00317AEDA7
MTSATWPPRPFDSSSTSTFHNPSPFDSLPYPYPQSMSSSTRLGVPQTSTLSPPGGGIRRARSSGALDSFDSNRPPPLQGSWSSHSPFSPATSLPPQRDESYPSFDYYRRPSSTSVYPLPDYPQTPTHDNPRRFHRRTSSAQPAFFANGGSGSSFTRLDSIASGSDHSDPSSRKTSMSYSMSDPSSHRMQGEASAEDVDKFLKDMKEMLGPDAMGSFEQSPTTSLPPRSQPLTLTSTSSPPSRSPVAGQPPRQTYNVSGVLLSEEEYRQYAHSEQSGRHNRSSSITHHPQYFLSPGYDLERPKSAPPSPQVDPSATFAPYYSPSPPNAQYSTPFTPSYSSSSFSSNTYPPYRPFHRRGSSVDATIPRTFVTTPSIPAYGYASFPTPPSSSSSPSRSNQPVGYPPPFIPQEHFSTPPPYSTPPVARMFSSSSTNSNWNEDAPISPVSPIRSRGFGAGSGPGEGSYRLPSSESSSPTKSRGGGGGRGGKVKGPISFINFSADDSKVLLSGVAPSGSSKKRQREESAAMSTSTSATSQGALEGGNSAKKGRK